MKDSYPVLRWPDWHFQASQPQQPLTSCLGWASSTSLLLLYALPARTYFLLTTCVPRIHFREWFLVERASDKNSGLTKHKTDIRLLFLNKFCDITFFLYPAALQTLGSSFPSLFCCFNQPTYSQMIILLCVLLFSENKVVLPKLKYKSRNSVELLHPEYI